MCTIIAEVDRDGRLKPEINEEELKESLRCEMLENCTPQFCCTCQEKFSSQVDSKAHYDGKPHQRLLQIKLKIMLRKKISEENLRKKLGDPEVINSAIIATEIKQIVTTEMSGGKHSIKEETRKRPGDHLDEMCDLPSDLLEKCKPTYCGVCDTPLTENNRTHYAGKPHKKKLKLVEMGWNPTSNDCSLCQVTNSSEVALQIHRQGYKHKSKEAQLEPLRTQEVKTKQAISIQSLKSGSAPQKENVNGLHCDVCGVTGTSEMDLIKHLNGKPHKENLGLIQKGKNRKAHKKKPILTFTCYLCQVSCNSQETLEAHMNGKAHKNALEMFATDLQVVSYRSFEEPSEQKNFLEELEKYSAAEKNEYLSVKESMPTQVAVMMNENSVMIDKKTDVEIKDIRDSMSMQSAVRAYKNASEKSLIKDEKMDDGENKGFPDLRDSMSNLEGYSDIVNNELKIKLNQEKELLYPAEIEKSSTSKSSEEQDIVLVTENIEVKKISKGDDECEDAASSDDDLRDIPDSSDSMMSKAVGHDTDKSVIKDEQMDDYENKDVPDLCDGMNNLKNNEIKVEEIELLHLAKIEKIPQVNLPYLANNVLSNNDREKVHIFSTMFYKRLLQSPRADAKKVPEYETDASLTTSEIRHFRVASWTKSVDLFEKDMLIIPICEEFHWYLLLVVKPGVIFLPFEAKERKERGEPFMIVLDSVGGRNNASAKNIRRYLACEWNKKKCAGAELLTNLEQMGKNVQKIRPNKPEQENNSDCGIFLLQYVETVFRNVSAFMWPFLVNMRTKEWFTSQVVAGKRGEIAHLIKRLTEEQKPGEVIEYPNIKFIATGVDDV